MELSSLKLCFDKLVDVYKVRGTFILAFAFATVTLTGYGLQHKIADIFYVAAAVPLLALLVDVLILYRFATPLAYKLFLDDPEQGDPDSLSLLFLDFASGSSSKYSTLLADSDAEERQKSFRYVFLRRRFWLKSAMAGSASAVELVLAMRMA